MVRGAIIVCAVFIAMTACAFSQEMIPSIEVHGNATLDEPAEVLRLTMTIIQQGKTAEEAYQNSIRRAEDMIRAFRRFGFGPEDYITKYVVERRPHPHERKHLVFLAAVGLSLVVDDFSAGTQMLDVATQYGVRDFVTYFDITDRRSAYDRALRRALADARLKAEMLAAESGVKLGALVGFEELSEPPGEYEYPQPLVPKTWTETDQGQVPPEGAGSVRMSPQPTEITATVRAAYRVIQ